MPALALLGTRPGDRRDRRLRGTGPAARGGRARPAGRRIVALYTAWGRPERATAYRALLR